MVSEEYTEKPVMPTKFDDVNQYRYDMYICVLPFDENVDLDTLKRCALL